MATELDLGLYLHYLSSGEDLSVALVCLDDAYNRFLQARMALCEAFACLIWYREESPKAPLNFEAALTGRFYVDYVGLLLYAAGEDIGAFVTHFLGIKDDIRNYLEDAEVQKKLERKKISSNAAKVGLYLKDKFPDHEVTTIICDLHNNQHWQKAITYRNNWVHEQPPIVAEMGVQYARESRGREAEGKGRSISFGGGNPPKYTIDKLLDVMVSATDVFAAALWRLLEIVIRKREEFSKTSET